MLGVGTQQVNARARQFSGSANRILFSTPNLRKWDRGRILHSLPRFSAENITANMPMVDLIRQCAEKKNALRLKFRWLGCSQKTVHCFDPRHTQDRSLKR